MIALVALAFLIFARVAALLMALPLFGGSAPPRLARTALAIPLTVVLLPAAGRPPLDLSLSGLVAALVMEILLGAATGFAAQLIFHVLATAFETVAAQAGLSVAALLDPISGQQAPVLANLGTWIATALFLGLDMHLAAIQSLGKGLALAPPGSVGGMTAVLGGLVSLAELSFESAVQIAGPVTLVVFAVHLGQGILGRMAPNIQLFWAIGPMLSVGLGLAVLAAGLPSLLGAWLRLMPAALRVMDALPTGP